MKARQSLVLTEIAQYRMEVRLYLKFANEYEIEGKEHPHVAKEYAKLVSSLRAAAAELLQIVKYLEF